MSREHDSGHDDCGDGCEPLHNNPSRARTGNTGNLVNLTDSLKAAFPDNRIQPIPTDHYYTGGEWATPCMCGHHSHGYSGHREDMCCDDCEDCGGYEPQPGMALPTIRREGMHPFLLILRSRP
jgi:hypothetical protein